VERAVAACASLAVDVEPDILARQTIGQRPAPGRRLARLCFDGRTALSDAGDIAVEVFQGKRHLAGIETFGAAPELCPLELLDDKLKAFDFAVAALDDGRHVVQQMVQKTRIDRQIGEVDSHVQFYYDRSSNRSISPLFGLIFSAFSASDRRSPDTLGNAPIDAFDQHGELRRRQGDRAARLDHARPHEAALIEPLGEQTQPVPVPEKDLDDLRLLAPRKAKRCPQNGSFFSVS
jgi:hypothetical protein